MDVELGRPGVHNLDREASQQNRFGADRLDACLRGQLDSGAHRDHAQDRRRPADHAANAAGGGVARAHLENVPATHPAPDRLLELTMQVGPDVAERRCARSTAQILVGAAHREVDAPVVEVDRDRTRRVTQIPQDQGADVVRDRGDRGYVGDEPRAVGHVAEDNQRCLRADDRGHLLGLNSRRRVRLDPPQRQPALGRDPFQDIAIRREVVGVQDDLGAIRPGRHRRPRQLVEHDGGRVGNDGLTRRGPDDRSADEVTKRLRPVHPLVIPTADQPGPPRSGDERLHPLRGDRQWPPEGVAVEVSDDIAGGQEAFAEMRQRVLGIEHLGASQRRHEVRRLR